MSLQSEISASSDSCVPSSSEGNSFSSSENLGDETEEEKQTRYALQNYTENAAICMYDEVQLFLTGDTSNNPLFRLSDPLFGTLKQFPSKSRLFCEEVPENLLPELEEITDFGLKCIADGYVYDLPECAENYNFIVATYFTESEGDPDNYSVYIIRKDKSKAYLGCTHGDEIFLWRDVSSCIDWMYYPMEYFYY